ncbi:hypothetical protein QBC37DRAFT_299640 [Rhypophila decipiens]|uniref:Centrosomin N-terminal motif 1 domain-containing protein n=1 Tax=Rhypophila decipiens TaxID=261697 RepID=A0AAN7B3M4_9PEZI|nr:hypothetical protein QBC37DRAFT_299640 [Rhypophila decipiens]
MDGYTSQVHPNDRPRPPPCPRAASRSSTSSTRTRLSNNSSTTSSQPVSSIYAQRLTQSRPVRTPTSDRPRSQLSREAPDDPRPTMAAPMSTFLQERLERERRVESERSSSRASDRMSGSGELRLGQNSPTKSSSSGPPQSSNGLDPANKKKGLGLKEMEQTLSTLHKQNFDLKLELYHRRERQTALEDRLEKLESDKAQIEQINDQLVEELEKRDKAVEEAVAMIVVLEARVEQLLREREIVRRFEEDGMFYSRSHTPGTMSTPKMRPLELPSFDDAKDLNRMPSFLSERSENTENLRNVYLGRGSAVSLPPMPEDTPQTERTDRINSPTLSVLSESSFMSIYGPRRAGSSPAPADLSPSMDGSAKNRITSALDSSPRFYETTPSKPRRTTASPGPGNTQSPFQNINNVLELGGSPLQRLANLEIALTNMNNASRPATSYQEKERPVSRPLPQIPPKTKQEKRLALEKVMTQGSHGREVRNSHRLPPTPDTISTTTLRRFQNSNETLSREEANERSYLAISDTTSQASVADDLGKPNAPSVTAFDSRRMFPENGSHLVKSHSGRPRSTSDSTVSQQRRDDWADDGSEGEGVDRAVSPTSSFDPWLKESMKPDEADLDGLAPGNSVSQSGLSKNTGRISPDLFSFPTSSNGWATHAMYGSLTGSPYKLKEDVLTVPMADTMDAIGRSLPTPLFGSGLVNTPNGALDTPPPAPNRRSSLHARTGSTATVLGPGSIPPSPARPSPATSKFVKKSPVRGSRARSNSIDHAPPPVPAEVLRDINRSATVPPKQVHLPPPHAPEPPGHASQPLPKQRHYPPTSSQAPRPRGLNNFFRRSTGSAEAAQQPPQPASASATPTESTFGAVGVPWLKRNSVVEDDRSGATPPPIMRNKAGGHRSRTSDGQLDADGGVRLDHGPMGGGAPIGVIPGRDASRQKAYGAKPGTSGSMGSPPPAATGGGKRRWLGIGRVGSLRKSIGAAGS